MKRSSAFRAAALSILVLAAAVIGVGGASVALNYNGSLTSTATVLNDGVKKVALAGGTLSSAIGYAENTEPPIAVAIVAFDKTVSVVHETDVVFDGSYSAGLLEAAVKHAVVIEGTDEKVPYQMRALRTAGNEYVLLATSIAALRAQLDRNVLILIIGSIISIGIGGSLVFWLARRNMKSAMASLTKAAEHERETREAMQNFMGDASHELRTPLTVIKGYSELLAKGDIADAAAREKAYARIIEQVNRMDETIASLLELAEVGSVPASSFVEVDLAKLVNEAADDLRAISPTREITVQVEPASIQGSPALLGKLLANAIGNIARHAGQKAEVNISLHAHKKFADLVIEDGGKGLPDEAYARGVQAFQRFDPSRSRETGGTGLGMSIMNSIVEAHAGTMTIAKSKLGGLKLEIHLPLN